MASQWTLRRHVVPLDIAAMLFYRKWYKHNGPTFRYLSYDASPIKGREWFATVERVIKRADVCPLATGIPAVRKRLLPLHTLGACRLGLADKIQTHLHQVWLEYGPRVDDVRIANADVRQCLTDMGTEIGIADAKDTVGHCLGQPSADHGVTGHLYPLALCVPGAQHIIDIALVQGLNSLPWCGGWQQTAKVMCQWLGAQMHRDLLAEFLPPPPQGIGGQFELVTVLEAGVYISAEWRWKTLDNVTRGLTRVEEAIVAALARVSSVHQLASGPDGREADLLAAGRDPLFWDGAFSGCPHPSNGRAIVLDPRVRVT